MARTPSGKRRANLRAMIEYADEVQWPQILQGYEEGLSKREVSPRTGVVIKNFCENLRSALDWLAEEIRDACGISGPRKIYFPICSTRADFDDKMKHWFPGLDTHSPDVWWYLLSMQSFSPHGESWLTEFNDVNNENKHFDLVVPDFYRRSGRQQRCRQAWAHCSPRRLSGEGDLGRIPLWRYRNERTHAALFGIGRSQVSHRGNLGAVAIRPALGPCACCVLLGCEPRRVRSVAAACHPAHGGSTG